MNALQIPENQMRALRFEDVQQYLQTHGWTRQKNNWDDVGVYHSSTNPDAEILLPLSTKWGDYALRMGETIQMISEVEKRPVWEVLNDLSVPPSDVLRLRIAGAEAERGVLPLEDGLKLFQGGRDLLLAAACSAHDPKPYYPRKNFQKAVEFVDSCRLGQTERGSFVATILAPVPPDIDEQMVLEGIEEDFWIEQEPFARRATIQIMRGLQAVEQAIQNDSAKSLLESVDQGVSSNFCDALRGMQPANTQSSLEISMSWSRVRSRLPRSISARAEFAPGHFAIIEEAGRLLRERAQPKQQRLEGVISMLRKAPQDLFEKDAGGHVTMRTQISGSSATVKFALSQELYQRACDAHRDGRRVAITGVTHAEAGAKHHELRNTANFEILPEPATDT
ncbi:MAG: hypothetical protein ACFCD0_30065 [Gemmataceae bacterium]